ncbi:MAG: C69 family dipeptidase [Acidobacteriota bacterium]|jgi:dipeptidase|nr:C69 family dipeptidase [Acidobacteriota bacterium]
MKKLLSAWLILGLAAVLSAGDDCFTVLVGKNASDSGCVLLAHNEDDRGDSLFVNILHLAPRPAPAARTYTLRNGGTWSATAATAGLFWIEIPQISYADGYVNSHGVAIVSNATPSRESSADLEDGGIGFMLRRILAEQAQSARQAVLLAGSLVERFGYSDSGRTLCIADHEEAWVLHLIRGKRWIAQRVPDDQVAVIPNAYTTRAVELNDKDRFLGSSDIVAHAVARGWHAPRAGKPFDFAMAYSHVPLHRSRGNYLRQRRAIQLLGEDGRDAEAEYPFAFTPRKKIRLQDLFSLLRDHYEDTPWDLTDGYRTGSPNRTKNRTICTESTQYALVVELGRSLAFTETVPDVLRHRIWLALSRPDANAFVPWYPDIAYPETHAFLDADTALADHFEPRNKPEALDLSHPFRVYAHLADLVDRNYRERIRNVRREWKNFEDYVVKNLRKKEKEFVYIHRVDPALARRMIANHLQRLEYIRWFQALELIRGFQG